MSEFGSRLQFATFVAVGVAATATHAGCALFAHQVLRLAPLVANLVGYIFALQVSYVGNARLTFRRRILVPHQFLRFVVVSLVGLALNEGMVFLLSNQLKLPFYITLIPVVVVVPVITFVLARVWAFMEPRTT
jgi:putative flippase GtrA